MSYTHSASMCVEASLVPSLKTEGILSLYYLLLRRVTGSRSACMHPHAHHACIAYISLYLYVDILITDIHMIRCSDEPSACTSLRC